MSDTPRTDSFIGKQLQDRPEWVDADVARMLERELAEAKRMIDWNADLVEKYGAQLAEAQKDAERYRWLRGHSRLDSSVDAAMAKEQSK